MGRIEKQKTKFEFNEEEGEHLIGEGRIAQSVVLLSSSDDEEANEDLSLKIVEKSIRMRELELVPDNEGCSDVVFKEPGCNNGGAGVEYVNLSSLSPEEAKDGEGAKVISGIEELKMVREPKLEDLGEKSTRKKLKKRKNKVEKIETGEGSVVIANVEDKTEAVEAADVVGSLELNAIDTTDNSVFRKLIRVPRYFDPPQSSWGKCYNCDEEGHIAANCALAKRNKPCYICGSLEHNAKTCSKGQDCFICKKSGHWAKDCPEKYKKSSMSLQICLKCGDVGHEMYSCYNEYSFDDLKSIQCYVCKNNGHLCCFNFQDTAPPDISCYRCGQLGHTGLACTRLNWEAAETGSTSTCFKCYGQGHFARECTSAMVNKRSYEAATPTRRFHQEGKSYLGSHSVSIGSHSSCFTCGEEGHFARECTSSAKVRKRNHEKYHTEDYSGLKSAPYDVGVSNRKKNPRYEDRHTSTPQKSKHRGGWIMEDPEVLPSQTKFKKKHQSSPITPPSKGRANSSNNGHFTDSRSPAKKQKSHSRTPVSHGSSKSYQHGYSSRRFDNHGNGGGTRRNYDRW